MTFATYLREGFYNDILCPSIWSEKKIDKDIRDKLVEIAGDFATASGVYSFIKDITLTGSLANYNYTKHSDLDVHILLDFKKINRKTDLVKDALDGKRFIWNLRHDITIRGHEVELYFQDTNEKHESTGVYSLLNDEWLKEPKYDPPEVDKESILKKYKAIKRTIELLEKALVDAKKNPEYAAELHEYASKYKERIHKMRKDSLIKHGEFGTGNLVYKQLRNTELIDKITKIANSAYDHIYTEKYTFKKYWKEYE